MIFSLFDIKSQTYGPMFEARTADEAKRILATAIASGHDPVLFNYTEDFNLVCVCPEKFDNCSELISYFNPDVVCSALDSKKLVLSLKSTDLGERTSTAVELAEQPVNLNDVKHSVDLCEV